MKPSQSEQTFKHECEFFSVQGKNIHVKLLSTIELQVEAHLVY